MVIALLLYLDQNGLLVGFLVSCTLHELGHWAAICVLGGKVRRVRISCIGAEMRLSDGQPLSPNGMVLAALAGPMVNLALYLLCGALAAHGAGARWYLFSALNFGLGCFNLLPTARLDGGWALKGVLLRMGYGGAMDGLLRLTTLGIAFLLIGVGGILMWQYGGENFTVLLMGLWLLGNARSGA